MPLQRLRPEDLKPGPIRHQQLPPELMTRIESLRSTLDEVYPMSMGEWLDGFQRDAHPEQEVIWWELRCSRRGPGGALCLTSGGGVQACRSRLREMSLASGL